MDFLSSTIAAASALLVVAFAAIHLLRRHKRQARDTAVLADKVARNLHIPRSLHPVIDPAICIGSLSCLKACPEGDILGVVNGSAHLIHADHCIGHGRCAAECPVGAIRLVFGTSERGVDLPEVDQFFESSRRGVHVVGELGGMGLIKNAVRQGLQVAERLAGTKEKCPKDFVDVAVVGAGPAGLATALGLKAAGLSFRVFEQTSVGGSVAHYPRQKVVMTEPVEIPYLGRLRQRRISKEELLANWEKALSKAKISVHEGIKVEGIEGEDGRFTLVTPAGKARARKVVLATGRRGTPRRLGVPGEELPKVAYNLIDPEQYQGCHVLVVGGGDVALESAIRISEETDGKVSISYRGEAFGKCREENRKHMEKLIARKRVRALMSSQVDRIAQDRVTLSVGGRKIDIPNDFVLVHIGGELPLEFLAKVGVGLRRYFGEAPGDEDVSKTNIIRLKTGQAHARAEKRSRRWKGAVYALAGATVLGLLTMHGLSYYQLSPAERLRSPLHQALRPAGIWGHGVGIVATGFMLSNFLYALRKRWKGLASLGSIRSWLDFHVFVGFMSPLVIAFHAAFRSNNLLASGTSTALAVVVLTGIIGRFIYGVVPAAGGQALDLADLLGDWERIRAGVEPLVAQMGNPQALRTLLAEASSPAHGGSILRIFPLLTTSALRTRWRIFRVRRLFEDRTVYAEIRDGYLRLQRLRLQIAFYSGLKGLLSGWRVFHAALAGFLVVAIALHIAVSLYLGYGWK